MPRNITVTFSDGSTHVYKGVPDDATPEQVTERAQSETGKEVSALDGGAKGGSSAPRSSGSGGWNPTVKVVKDGRAVANAVYPGLRITQVDRDPNSPLGRKNPNSWHNHTSGAIDVDANSLPKGMTFEQYVEGYRKAGYTIVHAKNEDETRGGKRAGHATGNHWHVVLGPKADGTEETVDIVNPEPSPAAEDTETNPWHKDQRGISDMVSAGKTADEIVQAYPQWESQKASLQEWVEHRSSGNEAEMKFGSTGLPATVAQAYPQATPEGEEAPSEDGPGFFGIPSLAQLGKGLEYGTGAIVEGIGDTAGIVINPLATTLGRTMGYDGYTADLGGTMRDGLGLDRPAEGDTANRIAGDIVSGATGGMTFAGGAGGLAKLATSPAAAQALAKLAATPVRDAVAGGTAALAGDAAEAAGGGAVAQTAAAIGGGILGHSAPSLAKAPAALRNARDTRLAKRAVARSPREASFDGEIEQELRTAAYDGATTPHDPKGRADLTATQINAVEKRYTAEFRTLLNDIPMHPTERKRLKSLITGHKAISTEEMDAYRGTVEGDALADSFFKIDRLRALTKEVPPSKGKLAGVVDIAAGAADVAPLFGMPGTFGGATAALNIARKLSKNRGGNEAARVNSAQRVLDRPGYYSKLRELAGPSGQRESQEALWTASREGVDAKLATAAEKVAAQQAKAQQAAMAKAASAKLKADNQRVGVKNDLDNIKPGGGFRGAVYDQTGLLPAQQDAGALNALWKGAITPEQHANTLSAPEKLMPGNAGNSLIDRYNAMASEGKLTRDPNWKPAEAPPAGMAQPPVDAQGQPIRSMPAYQAGVQKNIAREMPLLQELDSINAERAAKYDSDPEFAKIAGISGQDPYLPRILELHAALKAMKTGTPVK